MNNFFLAAFCLDFFFCIVCLSSLNKWMNKWMNEWFFQFYDPEQVKFTPITRQKKKIIITKTTLITAK